MTTIITRAGKGSPLTNNELDSNFTNLNSGKVEVGVGVTKTSDNGAAAIPAGTTAQRPAYSIGLFRYNTTLAVWEGSDGASWKTVGLAQSNSLPAMNGVAAAGTSIDVSRGDHIHPVDTSRAAASAATAAGTSFTPAGEIAAVNVQSAIQELESDVDTKLALKANLSSPAFSGTPTAPTAIAGTNTTQVATCAFSRAAASDVFSSSLSDSIPLTDGAGSAGTSVTVSRSDHSHPSDASKANLASPVFSGAPAAPTPASDSNSTQIATTSFVRTAIGSYGLALSNNNPVMDGTASAGTSTAASKSDHVHPSDSSKSDTSHTHPSDPTKSDVGHTHPSDNTKANIASPTFTGIPSAPTASVGTNTTQLATTAFVLANAPAGGSSFPAGTRLLFPQAAAPTGWTRVSDASMDDRMLRVVNTGVGGDVGGTHSAILCNVVPSHTHTFTSGTESQAHTHTATVGNQSAQHNHGITDNGHSHTTSTAMGSVSGNGVGVMVGDATAYDGRVTVNSYGTNITINNSTTNHNHTVTLATESASHTHSGTTAANGSASTWTPKYLNLILCSKD